MLYQQQVPGNAPALVHTEIKDVSTGGLIIVRWSSTASNHANQEIRQ